MLPATPEQMYNAWMTSAPHAKFTGEEAQINPNVGGKFTTFGGWATGENVELIAGKKIVQTWRADDWPAGAISTVTVQLIKAPKGTKVLFSQTGIPANKAKDIAQGWREYYWEPLKTFFEKNRNE